MLRVKMLCGSYQEFNYQAAIDMFDSGTGVGEGLLAQLAREVSDVQVPCKVWKKLSLRMRLLTLMSWQAMLV